MKLLTLFLGTLLLCSCGSDKYPVSFHMQTGASDSQKFSFRNEDDGYYYSKVPFISQNDIDSYYSFRAADNTYGAVFNIKKGLHSRVEGVTALNLGKQILPIVNGHRMQPMRLYNNPIKGGKLASPRRTLPPWRNSSLRRPLKGKKPLTSSLPSPSLCFLQ